MCFRSIFLPAICAIFCSTALAVQHPQVRLDIGGAVSGQITIELYPDKAPVTVENFLQYVRTGFYDDLIFHRVIQGFMIQGGGYYVIGYTIYTMPTNPPIINESYNNLSNLRGTVAMARTSDPNSATAEFYINHVDNTFLNRKNSTDVGYCVFGNVISGMDIVDAIAATTVIDISYAIPGFTDFPDPPVIINSAKLITPGCWINADINNDGISDLKDYAYLAANWKKSGSNLWGDLDQNNAVDMRDVLAFSQGWLQRTSWYKPFDEDINSDKIVNSKDFALMSKNWQKSGRRLAGDFNKDGVVNSLDLFLFAEHWLAAWQ